MKFTKEQAEDPIRKGDWLFIDDSMVRIDHITLVSPYHENADHPDSVALYFNTGEAKAWPFFAPYGPVAIPDGSRGAIERLSRRNGGRCED